MPDQQRSIGSFGASVVTFRQTPGIVTVLVWGLGFLGDNVGKSWGNLGGMG